jgi:hypothetical protein
MNCGCLVDVDNSDVEGEVLDRRWIKAPEDGGECCECGRLPKPCESYFFEWIKWESGDDSFITCPDCKSIRDVLCCNWRYGSVIEDIEFELEDMGSDANVPESCMEKLTPAARLMVADMIDEAWDRYDETWGDDDE